MNQAHTNPSSARLPEQSSLPVGQAGQYLTFMLGREVFALGILAVKEIIEYSHLTEVPMMPAYVRGVINLRGAVVPVIDLSVRFGRQANERTRRTCIVIVEVLADQQPQDVGIIVDAVDSVVEVQSSDIEPPPAFGTKLQTDFIQGMGKVNNRFVILLNVLHVLAVDDSALTGHASDGAAE